MSALPRLLLLGGLLAWSPMRAGAQSFQISRIADTNVPVGYQIGIPVSVVNPSIPANQLNFGLAPTRTGSPNSNIDTNGLITWGPTSTQQVTFTVTVTNKFFPFDSTFTNFTVTVTNVITPVSTVVIDAIPPQTVAEGTTLIFTNHAHATDNPANALVFSLVNAPGGASITNNSPTNGVFTWTPTAAQALIPSYTIRELVTEPSASVSNYQDFQVTITRTNDCAEIAQFLAAVQQGGYFMLSNCTTIVLTNTLTISNSVTLDAGTNNVTIAGNNLFRLFTILPGVTLTLRGITLSGGQDPNGGGLYISQGAVVVLTNCTLAGNLAAGASGLEFQPRQGAAGQGRHLALRTQAGQLELDADHGCRLRRRVAKHNFSRIDQRFERLALFAALFGGENHLLGELVALDVEHGRVEVAGDRVAAGQEHLRGEIPHRVGLALGFLDRLARLGEPVILFQAFFFRRKLQRLHPAQRQRLQLAADVELELAAGGERQVACQGFSVGKLDLSRPGLLLGLGRGPEEQHRKKQNGPNLKRSSFHTAGPAPARSGGCCS